MRQTKFYKSLRFKISIGLVGLLSFTMSILFIIQYVQHREKLISNLQENISPHLTQMVNDVLKSSMLSKNKSEMKYILEVAHQYPDVKNIFILNRIGRIIISIDDKEVGKIIDIHDPTCQACHHRTTEALNKTVIYSSLAGEKIFRNVNPIYNRKECFSCHHPEEKITGVLVTDFTLENIETQLQGELKGNILLLFFIIGISTLVIGIALDQLVIKKIQYFVEAASIFGQGDFKRIISIKSDDEMRRLADSFNQMAKTLMEKMRLERKYLSQIIEAQENERKRISRELHDEIGQALTAIKFDLDIIDKDLPPTFPIVRERLMEAKSLSNQVLTAMRQLSMDLRPTMLDDVGLIPTLRWYTQKFSDRLNIPASFQAVGFEKKLPARIETGFYRIIQEALNNIAKHSEASRVEISLERRDSIISASITDNGKGFDLDKVLRPDSLERGFGIIGMQERISFLGGRLIFNRDRILGPTSILRFLIRKEMVQMKKIRVLIAEDHTIVRQGLSALLRSESDIEVVGEASDGLEATEMAKKMIPDVVLMDIAMRNLNGLDATRNIKKLFPQMKVLVLTMYDSEEIIFQVLKAGASGYLIKDSAMTDLVSAIRAIYQGDSYLSPSISKKVIEEYIRWAELGEKACMDDLLSTREREILQLIAEGNSIPQIASHLCISKKTVEAHKTHIMEKLNIHDKAGLIKYAIRTGLTKL